MDASIFGGYGAYILGAYSVFLAVFSLNALGLRMQSRRIYKHLKKQIERSQK